MFLKRDLTLRAEYLPGHLNQRVDALSREVSHDPGDWKLDQTCFQALQKEGMGTLGGGSFRQLDKQAADEVLQLASRHRGSGQGCAPSQLGAAEWLCLPTIHPSSSLPKENSRGGSQGCICSASVASTTMVPHPIKSRSGLSNSLPSGDVSLSSQKGEMHPLIQKGTLFLAGWLLSGNKMFPQAFQRRLQSFSTLPRDLRQTFNKTRPGESGWPGVIKGKLIPFHYP